MISKLTWVSRLNKIQKTVWNLEKHYEGLFPFVDIVPLESND